MQAFLSGGYLPVRLRGGTSDAFIHVADWYATLSTLVGVDPSDTERAVADIDGVDVWPMVTRANLTNPREYLPVTKETIIWQQRWKLITKAGEAYWYTPNDTHVPCEGCTNCLFDVAADPEERDELSAAHPDIVQRLQAQLATYTVYTQQSMTATELASYDCIAGSDGVDPATPVDGWPWGPPAYADIYAGPCCFWKGALKRAQANLPIGRAQHATP